MRWGTLFAVLCAAVVGGCDDTGTSGSGADGTARVVRDSAPPVISVDAGDANFVRDCEDDETRPCGVDEGECVAGVERCVQGLWTGTCDGERAPIEERCNTLDDDCDGLSDEGLALGTPCKTRNERNLPEDGVVECDPETELPWCAPLPDCEDDLDADGFNTCQDCDDDDRTVFPDADERCDGVDNDCDDRTDEGWDLDRGCFEGEGVCQRGGRTRCGEFGDELVCDAEPAPVEGPELCGDAEDNDCDGSVDEGLEVGVACMVGEGACRVMGVTECTADRIGVLCRAEAAAPDPEVCGDGEDNDCDGLTDEGFEDVGERCEVGEGECRAVGEWRCSDDGLRPVCGGDGGVPIGELCGNGLDDDCDGEADEGFGLGEECAGGIGACERGGIVVCAEAGDGAVCSAVPGMPAVERCGDEIDNDCDARVDEGFDVGQPCVAGIGACEAFGVQRCAPGGAGTVCDARPGPPARESCNLVDDDCDGRLDEGLGLGAPCSEGIGRCEAQGEMVCDFDGGTVCDAIAGRPELELCDEVDNDCDEAVDEDFDLGDACDDPEDADLCALGMWACDDDGMGRVCVEDEPQFEVCNNRDDDCDDRVDNGIDVFTDPLNCGNCGFVCPGPTPECIDAACFKTYWVDAVNGSNADGDGTRLAPWRTITFANGQAQGPRARIYALAGRYSTDMHATENEMMPIRIRTAVQLVGFGDVGSVVIDGHRSGHQIEVHGTRSPENLVENIAIVNAGGQFGSAIDINNSDVQMRNIGVSGARSPNGWGVLYALNSSVEIRGLQVTDCQGSGSDGLLRLEDSTVLIDSGHLWANQAGIADSTRGIVWNVSSSLTMRNTSFANNRGHAVYHTSAEGQLDIQHCSFAGHLGSGLNLNNATTVNVSNSVFAHNTRYGIWEAGFGGDIQGLESTLFFDNGRGDYFDVDGDNVRTGAAQINGLANASNNLTGDPSFISLPASNLRLREGSACVDAGDPVFGLPVDQDGRARPRGLRPDVGAFESFLEP